MALSKHIHVDNVLQECRDHKRIGALPNKRSTQVSHAYGARYGTQCQSFRTALYMP